MSVLPCYAMFVIYVLVMKSKLKNITVTLEAELALWARVEAARNEMSMSRFLALLLRKQKEEKDQYAAAIKRAIGRKAFLKTDGKYLSREETHERDGVR
jgi:hypothetical protein